METTTVELIHANAGRLLGEMLGTREGRGEFTDDQIGPYRLCELLGEGGFGKVWRGVQTEPVHREVAVKVIKLGMDTAEVLSRFNHERQALASLDHDGIATMLDAGASADGRPWFAMELVRGEPITQWCETRRSPIHERLRLFKLVCQAVHHAHQKGIIHRDLKPSNILVTSQNALSLPKVIDFGIAKAIHHGTSSQLSLLTRTNQIVGTPMYMSPEHLGGDETLDVRSDVYALGVLLYELLAGVPPFESVGGEGIEGMKRRVREQAPQRLSTVMRSRSRLAGDKPPISPPFNPTSPNYSTDLDWITMKALEKDRERRYQSAADLAEDIQRFLNHQPVSARPPTTSYVLGRWIQRNRRIFAAACLIALSLIGGTVIALWQAARARAAEKLARSQAAEALESRHIAEQASTRAQQNAAFLTSLLERVTEEIKKGRNPEALRFALAGSAESIKALGNDHELRIELLDQVAKIYENLGETKLMLPLMELQASEAAQVYGPQSPEAREAQLHYIRGVMDHGNRIAAPALFEQLRKQVEATGERGSKFWFDVQRQLIRAWVKLMKAPPAIAAAEEYQAEAKQRQLKGRQLLLVESNCIAPLELAGEYEKAEQLLEHCRNEAQKYNDPGRLAELDNQLIHILRSKKDYIRAANVLKDIIAKLKAQHGERSPKIVPRLLELCEFERSARHYAEAAAHGQEILQIVQNDPLLRDDKASALLCMSRTSSDMGDVPQAVQLGTEALRIAKLAGKDAAILRCLEGLATTHLDAKNYEAAADFYQQHLAMIDETHANYKDAVEAELALASIRVSQSQGEAAMQVALSLWARIEAEPSSTDEPELRRLVAKQALRCYDLWRKTNPTAPDPKPLAVWRDLAAN